MIEPLSLRVDDLANEQTRALLAIHLAGMHANTPAGHVFALDLSGLKTEDMTVWSAWRGEEIAGIAALKALDATHGELKSMRTHPDHLRQGVAGALLAHILGEARRRGMRRVSLETGRGDAFEPALALYRRSGFANGEAFGEYEASEFNQFLHLDL
jgi:putative acetyltransferase